MYDQAIPEGHAVTIQVSPPTAAQGEEMYQHLSTALAQFPEGSPAAKELRQRGLRSIHNFAFYPKKVKMLCVSVRDDGERASLIEYFVDDERLVMRDENGRYEAPLPPRSVLREDAKFGRLESWARKRYHHLIEFEL